MAFNVDDITRDGLVDRIAESEDLREQEQTYNIGQQEGAFQKGLRAALTELPGAALAARGVARQEVLGDTEGAEEDLREAGEYFRRGEQIAPETKNFEDWESVGDATDAVLGTFGRMVPDLTATALAAAATFKAGGVGGIAMHNALNTARAVASSSAKRMARRAAARATGQKAGAIAGAAVPTAISHTGEVGRELTDPAVQAEWEQAAKQRRYEQSLVKPDLVGTARVIDGDTVHIVDPYGKVIDKIRPPGVNAADSGQEGYQRSTEALREMIDGRQVRVVGTKRDPFGRRLGHMYTDDSTDSTSERMLKAGKLAAMRRYRRTMPSYFTELEAQGRDVEGALPLWRDRRAIAPIDEARLRNAEPVTPTTGLQGQYRDLSEMTPSVAAGVAANTGLDLLPLIRVARRIFPGPAGKEFVSALDKRMDTRVLKNALAQGSYEAATEMAQTIVEQTVTEALNKNKPALTEEGISELVTAGVLGGFFGAVPGAIAGLRKPKTLEPPPPVSEVPPPPAPGTPPPPPSGFPPGVPGAPEPPVEPGFPPGVPGAPEPPVEPGFPSGGPPPGAPEPPVGPEPPPPTAQDLANWYGGSEGGPPPGAPEPPVGPEPPLPTAQDLANWYGGSEGGPPPGAPEPPVGPEPPPPTAQDLANWYNEPEGGFPSPTPEEIEALGATPPVTPEQMGEGARRAAARRRGGAAPKPPAAAANIDSLSNAQIETEIKAIDEELKSPEAKTGTPRVRELVGRRSDLNRALVARRKQAGQAGLPAPSAPPALPAPAGEPEPKRVAQAQAVKGRFTTGRGTDKPVTTVDRFETDERGNNIVPKEYISSWSKGETSLVIPLVDGSTLFLKPAGREVTSALYVSPHGGKPKEIPAGGIIRAIRKDPNKVTESDLIAMAYRAETHARSKTPATNYEWTPDVRAKKTSLVPVRNVYERIHPIAEEYGITTITTKADTSRRAEQVFGPDAVQFQRSLSEANEAMGRQGKVLVGMFANKMYFATPDQRALLFERFGLQENIKSDLNILRRVGTILKRPGGQEQYLEAPPDIERMNNDDGIDGTLLVSDDIAGTGFQQGTWIVQTEDGKLQAGKGTTRRTLTISRWDPETKKTEQIVERARLNEEMQFKKRFPKGEKAGGIFHTAVPIGDVEGRSHMGYQGVLGTLQDAASFVKDQTTRLAGKVTKDFLSSTSQTMFESGMPTEALMDKRSQRGLFGYYDVGSVRAPAIGVTQDGFKDGKTGLKPAVMDEDTREITTPGEVALLPGTYKSLNREFKKRHNRDLKPGDQIVLYRDPSLMDGSAGNVFTFVGQAKLNGEETPMGLGELGIVVNAQDKVGKAMALDFDGDALVAWVPDTLTHPRPMMEKSPAEPFTTGAPPIKFADGIHPDTPVDKIEEAVSEIYTGIDMSIGRAIKPARVLVELGLPEDQDFVRDSGVIAQGVISSQKKPVQVAALRDAMTALQKRVKQREKQRTAALKRVTPGGRSPVIGFRTKKFTKDGVVHPSREVKFSSILSQALDSVLRLEPLQHERGIEALIAQFEVAINSTSHWSVTPPFSTVERALFDRIKATHRIMRQHGWYETGASSIRRPPMLRAAINKSLDKVFGPFEAALGKQKGDFQFQYRDWFAWFKDGYSNGRDNAKRMVPEKYHAQLDLLASAISEINKANIELSKIVIDSEDAANKNLRAGWYNVIDASKGMLEVQYKLGLIDPEILMLSPLEYVSDVITPADFTKIYPDDHISTVTRLYDVTDVDGKEKPLPEGGYRKISTTFEEGWQIENMKTGEQFKIQATATDGMVGWLNDFMTNTDTFTVSETIPEGVYTTKRTDATKSNAKRSSQDFHLRRRKKGDPETDTVGQDNNRHQETGNPGHGTATRTPEGRGTLNEQAGDAPPSAEDIQNGIYSGDPPPPVDEAELSSAVRSVLAGRRNKSAKMEIDEQPEPVDLSKLSAAARARLKRRGKKGPASEKLKLGEDDIPSAYLTRLRDPGRRETLEKLEEFVGEFSRRIGRPRNKIKLLLEGRDDAEIRRVMGIVEPDAERLTLGRYAQIADEGDQGYIILSRRTQGSPSYALFHVVAHELGHAAAFNHQGGTNAMRDAHKKWADGWRKKYDAAKNDQERAQILADAWNDVARGDVEHLATTPDAAASLGPDYIFSYDEWVAENVSVWIRSDAKPRTAMEKVFKSIADSIKALFDLYQKLVRDGKVSGDPDMTVSQWMDAIWQDSAKLDPSEDVPAMVENIAQQARADNVLSKTQRAQLNKLMADVVAYPIHHLDKTFANRMKASILNAQVVRTDGVVAETLAFLATQQNAGTPEQKGMVAVSLINHLLNPEERAVLERTAMSPISRKRLARRYNDPRILVDDGYAMMKMWQAWNDGEIEFGKTANNLFARIWKKLRDALGIVTSGEQAAEILTYLKNGTTDWNIYAEKLRNPRINVMTPKQRGDTAVQRTFRELRKTLELVDQGVLRTWRNIGYEAAGYSRNAALRTITQYFHNHYLSEDNPATLHEARLQYVAEFSDRYKEEVLELLQNDPRNWERLREAWYENRPPNDADVRRAYNNLRRLMSDLHKYARRRGVAIEEDIEGFVPWVFDVQKLEAGKEEFITALVEHLDDDVWRKEAYFDPKTGKRKMRYKRGFGPDTTVDDEYRRRHATSIYHALLRSGGDSTQDFQDRRAQHTPYMGAHEVSQLRGVPQEIMARFLDDNIDSVVTTYINQTVRRAEFTKRFGRHGAKINELKRRARKLGATDKDIQDVERFIDGNMGTLGMDRPNGAKQRGIAQALMTYQNLRVLGLSALPSIADVAGVYWRSGDFKTMVRSISEAVAQYKANGGDLKRMGKMLGAINEDGITDTLNWEYGLADMKGPLQSINDALFRYNGTRLVTQFARTAGLAAGRTLIKEKMNSDNAKDKEELRHLGLKEGDLQLDASGEIKILGVDERSQLLDTATKTGAPYNVRERANKELDRDDRVRTALMRMVDESSVRPTPATRPIEANDQHILKMLIYHLQSYMWGFWENFTKRALLKFQLERPEKGVWNAEAIVNVLRLGLFGAMYMFAEMVRDVVQHGYDDEEGLAADPGKRGWGAMDWIGYSLLSSGIAGPLELAEQAVNETEQGHMPLEAFIGPTGQHMMDIIRGEGDLFAKSLPFQNTIQWWR